MFGTRQSGEPRGFRGIYGIGHRRTAKLRRRKVHRIFTPISAGFTAPEVSNMTIRHMLRPFRCDHIGTTLCTLT